MKSTALLAALAAVIALALAAPGAALAEPAVAVTTENELVEFDTASPGVFTARKELTGLPSGFTLSGLDYRPATGQVIAAASNFQAESGPTRLYSINVASGAATQIGPAGGIFTFNPFVPTLGFDFNPVVDGIRAVSGFDQNIRIDPDSGAVIEDTNLVPNTEALALAYDRNTQPAPAGTTLYGIRYAGQLVRIGGVDGNPQPNGGFVTTIGPLGLRPLAAFLNFDISGATGAAFATIIPADTERSGLFRINLTTGGATLIGNLAGPNVPVAGFTILPEAATPAPSPQRCQGRLATLQGTDENDVIEGTDGRDVIAASGGDDKVRAREGDDLVCGGSGDDQLGGNAGEDRISGQRGDDDLRGHGDEDQLRGGSGDDACRGGRERDSVSSCDGR